MVQAQMMVQAQIIVQVIVQAQVVVQAQMMVQVMILAPQGAARVVMKKRMEGSCSLSGAFSQCCFFLSSRWIKPKPELSTCFGVLWSFIAHKGTGLSLRSVPRSVLIFMEQSQPLYSRGHTTLYSRGHS